MAVKMLASVKSDAYEVSPVIFNVDLSHQQARELFGRDSLGRLWLSEMT